MASFKTSCNLCGKDFSTSKALARHKSSKHHVLTLTSQPKFYLEDNVFDLPVPRTITRSDTAFKQWLSGIVESINSSLTPKAAGKWCRAERYYCPLEYLEALLVKMPSALANSVKRVCHWRQPVWKKTATKISYKCFDIEEVRFSLNQQTAVELIEDKAFDGEEEIEDVPTLTGREAIALAKARVRGEQSHVRTPTCRSSLIVGPGEGRATREFEVMWWPDLYSSGNHGKISFRYYVAKFLNA